MKKETHPEYQEIVFQDTSSDFKFITRSTMKPTETNRMISESHFRPRTVILFTQSEGLEGFRETLRTAIGSQVQITETVDLQGPKRTGWKEKLAGGPWGLCDIAVIEPPGAGQQRAGTNETAKR